MTSFLLNWTGLDFAIAVILFLSALFGLIRGFVKEVISLIAWVAAFYAALKFAPDLDQLLHSAVPHTMTRYVVSVVIIFVAVVLLGCLVSKIIRSILKLTGFGFFDRLLGIVFGLVRGLVIATIVLVAIQATTYKNAPWVKQSQLAPYYEPAVTHFTAYLPQELRTASAVITHLAVLARSRA